MTTSIDVMEPTSTTTENPRRICLWSGPRNISTALMYSFAQRRDTRVVDEPLYAHYLKTSGADHPGRDTVLAAMEQDSDRVIHEQILGPTDRPILFMKQMAHHLIDVDRHFLSQISSVLLIRDPQEVLPSLSRQLPEPSLLDTGLKLQVELISFLDRIGQKTPILDSRELLLNPESVLQQLCQELEIPFDVAMLTWTPGARSEDGVWAPHWYENVHRSNGFQAYEPKPGPFPDSLKPLLRECRPYYETMYERAIRARREDVSAATVKARDKSPESGEAR